MKQSERTEQTKEKIIAAAIEEFGTHGYVASSLNSICSKHDIAKGLIYHNFKDKDTLYLACTDRCFSVVTAYFEESNTHLSLELYLNLRYRFFSENPLYARIFFEAILQPPAMLKESIRVQRRNFDALNREIYRSALQKMTLRNGISEAQALSYFEIMQEMFNGYFSSSAYAGYDFSVVVTEHEEKLNQMLDFMLYGIVKEGVLK